MHVEYTFDYTAEDFETEAPYKAVLAVASPFERDILLDKLAAYAKDTAGINFKKLYRSFLESRKRSENTYVADGTTGFTGQPIALACGKWRCDDFGVMRDSGYGEELVACPHPILPVERLVNIDTGEEKIRIAYSKGKHWRRQIVPRITLSSATKIVELASGGVSVNSENAKLLVRYLSDMEMLNYDDLPEIRSVGRLGHIGDNEFSPFMENVAFDGDQSFKELFSSVRSKGKVSRWKEAAKECRRDSVTARLMLAASFASVLVQPLGCLPFFVHLWGGDSGTGKTVGLMLAASVWGNPALGKYVQTFNGTVVGFEKTAEFLNSLPLCLDELQLTKDGRGRQNFNVYQLAQGVGRTRGNRSGGVQQTPTWRNCILTTGESPITSASDGAGALNRVIEIECNADHHVIADGHRISGIVTENYGFAGRAFVKKILEEGVMEEIKKRYDELFRELTKSDSTEKQSMAAALLVLADELVTEWIFHDGAPLALSDIQAFMKTRVAVSVGQRGYDYMCDWVTTNANRLRRGEQDTGDVYGYIDGNVAYVVRHVFLRAVEAGGYSPAALLSWMNSHDLLITRGKNRTVARRIAGTPTECVAMKLPTMDDGAEESDDTYI